MNFSYALRRPVRKAARRGCAPVENLDGQFVPFFLPREMCMQNSSSSSFSSKLHFVLSALFSNHSLRSSRAIPSKSLP